jgi:hypothetical protein
VSSAADADFRADRHHGRRMPVALRSFRRLDPTAVEATVDRLVMRITRRFPDRNLGRVAAELSGLVGEVREQSSADRRRNRAIGLACR